MRLVLRLLLLGAVLGALAAWLVGCVSVVTPPPPPADPVTVYLVREARHTGLVLPARDGWWEYGYGEWEWYGRNRTAWYRVFPVLLWPTTGTLGRRRHASVAALLERFRDPPAVALRVSGRRAAALAAELARPFAARADALIRNLRHRMEFVPVAERFWLFHNCHDAVAEWLRQLGCRVTRVPVRLGLRVVEPAAPRTTPFQGDTGRADRSPRVRSR